MYYNHADSLDAFEGNDSLYELVNDDNKKKYVCKHKGCGKFFRYKSEIVRHTATHSESRPFICQYDNCFKAFKRNDALENHIRSSHTKETPFVCPFTDCGMKFTTHGSFRYHVLKHNKQGTDSEGSVFAPETPQEVLEPTVKQVKLNPPSEGMFMSGQESLKIDMKLGKDRLDDDFYVQPTRFASKIKWEMVNDDVEEPAELSTQMNDESQEDKFNQVVEENKLLKQKLQTSEKVIKSMQKQISDLLGNLFACQSQLNALPTTNPSLESFPSFSESLFQDIQPIQQKMEEPLLDMINYGDNVLLSPAASIYNNNESISVDSFLSFDKGFKSFDF